MKKLMIVSVFILLVFAAASFALAEGNATDESPEMVIEDSNESAVVNDSNLVVISPGVPRDEVIVLSTKPSPDYAARYCESLGYEAKTREDSTGKVYKVCIFPDGKECMQLELMRGKCGKEYIMNDSARAEFIASFAEKETIANAIDSIGDKKCQEGCAITVDGKDVTIKDLNDKQRQIITEEINAKTGLDLSAEDVEDKTVLRAQLSNGRWALVKYMPDKASEKALARLGTKCEETGCTLELKETGKGNSTKLVYSLGTEKNVKLLGIFKKKMLVSVEVDAESGEVSGVQKPRWAFLAIETKKQEAKNETAVDSSSNATA